MGDYLRERVLLLLLLGIGCLATFLWLLRFRERLRITWWTSLLMAVGQELCGVISVMAFARIEGAEVGSISIFGAVFFAPVAIWINAKLIHRPAAEVFDILTIPMVFTLMLTRINCIASGCCYGVPIGSTNLLWPTREAEILFYGVFLFIIATKVLKGGLQGRVFPLYMFSYGIIRAVIECFRYSPVTNRVFHLSHVWAILSITVGLSIYLEMRTRMKVKK